MPSLSPSAPATMIRTALSGFSPMISTISPAANSASTTFATGISATSAQRGSGARDRAKDFIADCSNRANRGGCTIHDSRVRHHQTEHAFVGVASRDIADDASVAHDEDAVGERHDLVELDRYQKHRATGVAMLDELAMNELDGADIHAARRLSDQQDFRRARQLPRHDQFLLVAAGKIVRAHKRLSRPHVELVHQHGALPIDRVMALQHRTGVSLVMLIAE